MLEDYSVSNDEYYQIMEKRAEATSTNNLCFLSFTDGTQA